VSAGSTGRVCAGVVGTGSPRLSGRGQGLQFGDHFREQFGPGCMCGEVQASGAAVVGEAASDGEQP
jgi:hypothetical protein